MRPRRRGIRTHAATHGGSAATAADVAEDVIPAVPAEEGVAVEASDEEPRLTVPLELGPISSVLSGVEDVGAIMLDGIDPNPPPLGGIIVEPCSFRSCAGDTGTLKLG